MDYGLIYVVMVQKLSHGLDVSASEFKSNSGMEFAGKAFGSGPVKFIWVSESRAS